MTYFTHIRAGLMASALLMTTALASSAMAETLPEISPRQIARDVNVQYHPETGAREYVAPSFDPFEEDRNMAGTASLRSVSNMTAIDGKSVRGGALLDMTFYYNSASNDPYDTRGYEEAVYLSGEYAPVTRRDNRILECNEQVQDVVYYHEDYYRPSLYVNLFRPYRHYRGHFGYNRGYGYNYGRAYGNYLSHRSYRGYRGGLERRRARNRRNVADRVIDRAVDETRRTNREERRRNRADRSATRRNQDRASSTRRVTREERRANRNGDNRETRRDNRNERRSNRNQSDSTRTVTPRTNRALRMERVITNESAPRIRNNRVRNNNAPTPRLAPTARATAPAPRAERAGPAPRRDRSERSRPARAERAVNRAREIKSSNSPRRSGGRKGNTKLRLMGFMPMASAWSRNVVRNVDVQCAREEILSVHIPQERLDAARFDGLTVLVLDRTGAEVPVFIPPNYIEGFRQAVNGRVTPNVSYQDPAYSAPVTRALIYQEPRPYGVEEAPCPAGTTKQNDGTCLQAGTTTYGGYPTR